MTRLPETIDFDAAQFPALQQIFHELDTAIAALIASDPAFRPHRMAKRRSRTAHPAAASNKRSRGAKRAAA